MDWLGIPIGGYRIVLVVAMVLLSVATILVVRLLRKLLWVVVVAVIGATVVVALGLQIPPLGDCHETCRCSVFGQSIDLTDVASDWGCGEGRIQLG